MNGFNNSNLKKDNKNIYYHEAKKYKKKSKTCKSTNGLIQFTDGVLVLGVSSTCITLSVTRVGLVIVPIASGIGAGVCIFSKFDDESLKKKQHKMKKFTLAGGTLNNFRKLHIKCLEDKKIDLNEYNKLKQRCEVFFKKN